MAKVFKQKDWNESKTNDAWSIFKIMGEFVEGFETLQRIGPCISIYGSARMKEDSPVYNASRAVGRALAAAQASWKRVIGELMTWAAHPSGST